MIIAAHVAADRDMYAMIIRTCACIVGSEPSEHRILLLLLLIIVVLAEAPEESHC